MKSVVVAGTAVSLDQTPSVLVAKVDRPLSCAEAASEGDDRIPIGVEREIAREAVELVALPKIAVLLVREDGSDMAGRIREDLVGAVRPDCNARTIAPLATFAE